MHLDDDYRNFMTLYTASVTQLRAFLRKLLPGWEDVDEVMQNTSLVLWKKFEHYEPNTEFIRWAYVIARFEVLNYKRTKARDRHFFGDELTNLLADENSNNHELFLKEKKALQTCLNKLDDKQKNMTLAAYSGESSIKEVAEKHGRSATAFYKALKRIRTHLLKCIKSEIPAHE